MEKNKQPFKAEPLLGTPQQEAVINVLENLRELYKNTHCEETKKHIKLLIRTTLYFVSERRKADYISQEAKQCWDTKAKGSDLRQLTVPKQRANKNKKNCDFLKGIILEHCNPLSILIEKIITGKSIKTILKKDIKTAWITTSENKRLNKKYKSKRPQGWDKCYQDCKIKLEK